MKKVFYFFVFLIIFSSIVLSLASAADETYSQAIANALTNIQAVSGTNVFVPDYPTRGNKAMVTIQGNPSAENSAFGLKYQSNYGDGNNYLITRTLTNVGYYCSSTTGALTNGTGAYTTFGSASGSATWVTTGNEATQYIGTNAASAAAVTTTMERGLGINTTGTHTAIVEYGVLPNNNNLMRPTNLLDIKSYSPTNTDYTYHASFAPVNPGDISSTVFNNVSTYLKSWQTSALVGATFPWTELGYTYDWGHSTTDLNTIQGLSEFIILGGTAVKIIGIYSPQSYYYTKNKNGAFSADSDAQYGNGFGSFNVTGNCDTIWAGNAFQVNASTDVSNPNQIVIAGSSTISGGQGILVWSTNYTVTNNGTISGSTVNKLRDDNTKPTARPGMSGTANVALLFLGNTTYGDPGGKNILINSGSISSDTTTTSTAVEADAGNTAITNSGTISGYTYGIHLLNGTNSITNTGTISATGGAAGSAAIQIDKGTTTVTNNGAGTITGGLTVADDATAALNIGNNALTIGGTYTQNASATLQVTANSTTDFGSLTATNVSNASSKLSVTIGDYFSNNTVLNNVINGTGVSAPGTISSSSPIYTITATVSGSNVNLTMTRSTPYSALSTSTGNGSAAGAALEQAGANGATGDMLNVLNTLDSMNSSQQISDSIETMTPDMSSGTMQASQATTSQFLGSVSNRLGYARNGMLGLSTGDFIQGMGFWVQALGSNIHQGSRNGIEGYNANLFGTSLGADKLIDDHYRIGLSGGYGFAAVNSKTAGSPSDSINSFQGTLYGSYDSINLNKEPENQRGSKGGFRDRRENSWYVDGMFAFTQNNYDSRREIWLGSTTKRVAKGDHYGQQYSTKLESGYTFVFEMTKALETTPFASLEYSYLRMNRYKEQGADSLNLTVNGDGFNQMLQVLGMKFAYPFVLKKAGTFIPALKAAWLYDYWGDQFETTATFAGGGSSFTTKGANPAKNGMLLGTELAFLNKGNMTLTANYDLELKEAYTSNTYYATARFDF